MPLQNFVDGGLPTIKAAWLNAIDAFYTTLFNSSTTAAQARTALDVPSTTTVNAQVAACLPLAGGTLTGPVSNSDTTDSTSTITGSVKLAGGLGIVKALWVGGLANIAGAFAAAGLATFSGASSNAAAGANTLTVRRGQIGFPATQVSSTDVNTLDDYEEGTWTVGLTFGGNNTGIAYTNRSASYTKIGRMVSFTFEFLLSSKGSSTGTASITGLPFTASGYFTPAVYADTVTNTIACVIASVPTGGTAIAPAKFAAGAATVMVDTDFQNTTYLQMSGTYFTAT